MSVVHHLIELVPASFSRVRLHDIIGLLDETANGKSKYQYWGRRKLKNVYKLNYLYNLLSDST